MPKLFGRHLGITGAQAAAHIANVVMPAFVREASEQAIAGEDAAARLKAVLTPADHAVLTAWIDKRYDDDGKTHAAVVFRRRAYVAAWILVQCGVSMVAMTDYALRQVIQLCGDEFRVLPVQNVATAYAAIHTGVSTPAAGMIAQVTRDAFTAAGRR
jgi:hypothetical protein